MVSVEVQFIGGPKDDGKVWAVPAMDDGTPPPEAVCQYLAQGVLREGGSPDAAVPVQHFRYVRKVNPADDGPLWLYVPAPEYADAPDPWDPGATWDEPTLTFEQFLDERRQTRAPREPR